MYLYNKIIILIQDETEELENTDYSRWELKCPDSVDCVFIMAKSKDITCIKLLKLNPDNKTLYLEIVAEPEVIPKTLMLIGLQTIRQGDQMFHVVRAEGYTEITDGIYCINFFFVEII